MFELLAVGATLGSAVVGYLGARGFVRDRLRYVDAVQGKLVPILAGIGAAVIATPIVWILPLVGTGTALLFGAGVALGVNSGVRAIRQSDYRLGPGA